MPGVSIYLKPLGPNYLLGVGQQADVNGRLQGVKVELFDIRDIAHQRSVGANTFGRSWSEALFDFHALSFVTVPGASTRYRIGLPLSILDMPSAMNAGLFTWSYTGLHLFEVSGLENGTAQLHFQGVLKAEEFSKPTPTPSFPDPVRSVLHDDSVFYVFGDKVIASLWQDIPGG